MIKIAFRFLYYKLFAPHRRGYGIHSPFVFHLVDKVLKREDDEDLKQIAAWRRKLSEDKRNIITSDTGAGAKMHKNRDRRVGQIVRKSSIRHKYGRIIYSLAREFKPATIIELGTGIGISAAYLAKACPQSLVLTIDGDNEKMAFAAGSLEQIGVDNVIIKMGSFGEMLPGLLQKANHPLMVFVDGDHSYNRTLEYFGEIKKHANEETLIIFDDIRWSQGMEDAWNAIKTDPDVVLTIDLFFMGIVFFRKGMPKQDFRINF